MGRSRGILKREAPAYLQGRASTSQLQLPPDREQEVLRLPAREKCAQLLPYSRSVKSCHDRMAARCAAARLRWVPLLP